MSLKKFFDRSEGEDARLHVISTLMGAISAHAPLGEPTEHVYFQAGIDRMSAQLCSESEPAELLLIGGRAAQLIEVHNREAAVLAEKRLAELCSIAEMLTHTIGAISRSNARATGHLTELQQVLKEAAGIEEVRVLSSKIAGCLKEIEAEVETQNAESGITIDSLRQQLQNSAAATTNTVNTETDLRTGLPGRNNAEQALAKACRASAQTYAVVYVIDRFRMINNRFGAAIGDQAVRDFKEFIMQDCAADDEFFRWNDQTFLALMKRKEPIEDLRMQLNRTMLKTVELIINTETRNLTLSLTGHWVVFPMFSGPKLLIGNVEAFASEQIKTHG